MPSDLKHYEYYQQYAEKGALKTRFPCLDCGVSCPVRRLRDGEQARCAQCSEVRRLVFCAASLRDDAFKAFDMYNKHVEDPLELAVRMQAAAAKAADAAGRLLHSSYIDKDHIRATKHVSVAMSWMKWSEEISEDVRDLLVEEKVDSVRAALKKFRGLEVLDGGLAGTPGAEHAGMLGADRE